MVDVDLHQELPLTNPAKHKILKFTKLLRTGILTFRDVNEMDIHEPRSGFIYLFQDGKLKLDTIRTQLPKPESTHSVYLQATST